MKISCLTKLLLVVLLVSATWKPALAVTLELDEAKSSSLVSLDISAQAGPVKATNSWDSSDLFFMSPYLTTSAAGTFVTTAASVTRINSVMLTSMPGEGGIGVSELSDSNLFGSGIADVNLDSSVALFWTIEKNSPDETDDTQLKCSFSLDVSTSPPLNSGYDSGSVTITDCKFGVGNNIFGPFSVSLDLVTGTVSGNLPQVDDVVAHVGDQVWMSWTIAKSSHSSHDFSSEDSTISFRCLVSPSHVLSAHRVQPSAIKNGSAADVNGSPLGLDLALEPKTDLAALEASSRIPASGLVADGVTPLLIALKQPDATPRKYRISVLSVSGGNIRDINSDGIPQVLDLTTRIKVLQKGKWNDVSGNLDSFTMEPEPVTGSCNQGYAYIGAIKADELCLNATSKEVTCQMQAQEVDADGNLIGLPIPLEFKIRKPPIVLIHGYNTTGEWGTDFTDELGMTRPGLSESADPLDNFVRPIKYGVAGGDSTINTCRTFVQLAGLLNDVLHDDAFEGNAFRNKWAMTRYDVIAHSQGGALARMLCSQNANTSIYGAIPSFKSEENSFRGRFHRVITIGSPHNGSRLVKYMRMFFLNSPKVWNCIPAPKKAFIKNLLQPKFDPFNGQIRNLNKPDGLWIPDSEAKFLLFSTRTSGLPLFSLVGLGNDNRRSRVLPFGSDGVVDYQSQRASGAGDFGDAKCFPSVVHAKPDFLGGTAWFGAAEDQYDVGSVYVASRCMQALNGGAIFEAFPSLTNLLLTENGSGNDMLTLSDAAQCQSYEVDILETLFDVSPAPTARTAALANASGQTTVQLHALEIPGKPRQSDVSWFVEAYGAGGVTNEGVTITINPSDSTYATLTIAPGVEGDVIVYVNYESTSGELIFGRAYKAASLPPAAAMTGIELRPSQASLVIGTDTIPDVWGNYADGISRQLFVNNANLTYQSSDPSVVEINVENIPVAKAEGSTSVQASYMGFSANLSVTVVAPPLPLIEIQPAAQVASAGSKTIFDIVVNDGGAPLAYQWQVSTDNGSNWGNLTDTGAHSGVNLDTLTVSTSSGLNGYKYRCEVSNSTGPVTSDAVNLTVNQVTLTVTFTAGIHGSLSGDLSQSGDYAFDCTLVTAVPDTGYHFVNWTKDGVAYSTDAALSVKNVTADMALVANFASNTYNVTFDLTGKGTRTGGGELSQTINQGSEATAPIVTAANGWTFTGWDKTFGNITSDLTVTAQYAIATHSVTFVEGANGTLTGSKVQTISHGGDCLPVTAVPNIGCHFVDWTGGYSGTANPLTLRNITADMTLTANFAAGKTAATVILAALNQTYTGTPRPVTVTTVPAGLNVNIAYAGVVNAPTNAGSYAVTATVDDSNYTGVKTGTLVIAKASQTITFPVLPTNLHFGDADYVLTASASSLMPVTYASSAMEVATIIGGAIHVIGAGTTTISASQSGNDNWFAAPQVSQELTVAQTYVLSVTAGNGGGNYPAAQLVEISASQAPAGMTFTGWTGDTDHLASPTLAITTVTMPSHDVSVTANFAVTTGGKDGDFEYADNGFDVTITKYTGSGGAVTIPDRINGKPVISLGDYAFSYCGALTSVTIPNSVTGIGNYAFYGCYALTSITIPNSVTSIGWFAFYGCYSLTSVTIPNSVTSIGSGAFRYCYGLTNVTLSDSVTSIEEGTFRGCTGLTSVTIPGSVTSIGEEAFSGCYALTSITIPDSVSSIGEGAFRDCTSLASVTIPESVTSIGYWAFSCTSLTSVTIPGSVTSIGEGAFSYCTGLTAITVDASNPVYISSADGVLFNKNLTSLIACPGGKAGSYTIPSTVTSIGDVAFYGCTGLTSITIPDSVTSIGDEAFYHCTGLTSITIPDSVTSIGSEAFFYCTGLTSVTIPHSVTSIGYEAFYLCTGLTSATFLGNAPNMGSGVFDLCADNFIVNYLTGALGFTPFTWMGYPSSITYIVLFDLAGKGERTGGGELSQTINHGSGATAPTVTANAGWTFNGWDVAFNNITSNLTVTAQWLIRPPVIGDPGSQKAMVGVTFTLPLTITSESSPLKSVTVAGLPAGLKYDTKTKTIKGVPTAVPKKPTAVTVTAKNASKNPAVLTFAMTLEPLPAWASGTFNGSCTVNSDYGTATMTVTAPGKVTGKLSAGGLIYAFSAASYAQRDVDGAFWISTKIIVDKADRALTFAVGGCGSAKAPNLSVTEGWFANDAEADPSVKMYRNVWKDKDVDMKPELAPYIGYYTAVLPGGAEYGSGYLTITVDKTGGVKTAGKLADVTALSLSGPLLLDETGRVFTVIYTSPKGYNTGCLFGLAEFKPEAESVLLSLYGDKFLWVNRNPQATAVYDDNGFDRELGLNGGWYDKTENLYAYYLGKTLTVGADAGASAPVLTVGVNHYTSDWWNFSGIKITPVLGKADVLTGLIAPKAGVPLDPEKDNDWDYGAENTVGLKIGLSRATGVFKGSFKAWFDYGKTHTSKSILYEGVLIPECEDNADGAVGRGFYLWPEKGEDANPFPYKFNRSYDFIIQSTPVP